MIPANSLPELLAERRDGQPLIGAHRGGAAYAPENTLAAFAEGIRRGADMLELDIHLSRDGEVVVVHDHTVDRTTNGQGYVHDLTVPDLRRLDAGAWFDPRFAGERVPTLRDVIEFVDRRLPLTIEVKGLPSTAAALSDALVDLLEQMRMTDGVLVIAFDHEQIRRIKERNPAIKAAINYSGRLVDPIHAGRAAHADVLNQSWLYCDRAFCQQAHAHGFAVQCFVPSPTAAWDLARNGVDIMDTDEPDIISAATRRDAPRPANDAPSVFMTTNGSEQDVTVTPGEVGDKPIFRSLIQLYRYDMSAIEGRDLDAHGLYDYAYLDHYWTPAGRAAGRRPFRVKSNGQLAGFVLKAEHSYLGAADVVHNIAEFFIMRKWRRRGIGRQVAVTIFAQFPGSWEVALQRHNASAHAFWRAVIDAYTGGAFEEIDVHPPAWDGPVLRFLSHGR